MRRYQRAGERTDLIFIDLNMPEMDGIEFLKRLRGEPANARVRVIVHTATSPDSALRAVLALYSVDGILPKPVEPQQLLQVVDSTLDKPHD